MIRFSKSSFSPASEHFFPNCSLSLSYFSSSFPSPFLFQSDFTWRLLGEAEQGSHVFWRRGKPWESEAREGVEDIHVDSYPQWDVGAWVGRGVPMQMQSPPWGVRSLKSVNSAFSWGMMVNNQVILLLFHTNSFWMVWHMAWLVAPTAVCSLLHLFDHKVGSLSQKIGVVNPELSQTDVHAGVDPIWSIKWGQCLHILDNGNDWHKCWSLGKLEMTSTVEGGGGML